MNGRIISAAWPKLGPQKILFLSMLGVFQKLSDSWWFISSQTLVSEPYIAWPPQQHGIITGNKINTAEGPLCAGQGARHTQTQCLLNCSSPNPHHHNSCHPFYHLYHLPEWGNVNTSQYCKILQILLKSIYQIERAQSRDVVGVSKSLGRR